MFLDACGYGIGGILAYSMRIEEEDRPLAYANRLLTNLEVNYSITEKSAEPYREPNTDLRRRNQMLHTYAMGIDINVHSQLDKIASIWTRNITQHNSNICNFRFKKHTTLRVETITRPVTCLEA